MREFYTIYVVDAARRMVGRWVAGTDPRGRKTPVSEVRIATSCAWAPPKTRAGPRLIAKYNLVSIPSRRVRATPGPHHGRRRDRIIEAETTEDLSACRGCTRGGGARVGADIVRSRAPWLMITLGTSGLGALVVAQFESTIQRLAFIAVSCRWWRPWQAIRPSGTTVRCAGWRWRPADPTRAVPVARSERGFVIAEWWSASGVAGGVWQGSVRVGLSWGHRCGSRSR